MKMLDIPKEISKEYNLLDIVDKNGALTGMDLKWFCVWDYVLLLPTYP
jgi:hypothetical protein